MMTIGGLSFTDQEAFGELLDGQGAVTDCCGWPVTYYRGAWYHVFNDALIGTGDHDATPDHLVWAATEDGNLSADSCQLPGEATDAAYHLSPQGDGGWLLRLAGDSADDLDAELSMWLGRYEGEAEAKAAAELLERASAKFCDECGAAVPDADPAFSIFHGRACSLHPANTVPASSAASLYPESIAAERLLAQARDLAGEPGDPPNPEYLRALADLSVNALGLDSDSDLAESVRGLIIHGVTTPPTPTTTPNGDKS